jgi:hypothetical protein
MTCCSAASRSIPPGPGNAVDQPVGALGLHEPRGHGVDAHALVLLLRMCPSVLGFQYYLHRGRGLVRVTRRAGAGRAG